MATVSADDRRKAFDEQVNIEHEFYEESPFADENATRLMDLHAKMLRAMAEATKRQQALLIGQADPTKAELKAGAAPADETPTYGDKNVNVLAQALLSEAQFSNPGDAPVLEHCTAIDVTPSDPPAGDETAVRGMRVSLSFSENPYFENTAISRVFGLGVTPRDDFYVVSSDDGTVIRWKPGRDVTVKVGGKKTARGEKRPTSVKVPVLSIFRLFTKDGFDAFGEDLPISLTATMKPFMNIAAFAAYGALGTRQMQIDGEAEP